ncbi:CRISPR-associated protein, Csd2 family [Thermaerobacter subterraneus DSM 13965]|uniref:CRISPR-associated protein, Csd2 family n=2 Tax=Thermaerobacter TaxID=73918 RepID=K6QF32_9FIRM|nr:CRISPR-associated protein, Csd2 family [Thermaerobacter subterraneus DSM 13965]
MMVYTDPARRHEFVLLFDVRDGNPNGDPDAGNMPRIDPETMYGLVTDVALKRKVRDYVSGVLNIPIFIQSRTTLNTLIREAFESVGYVPPGIDLDPEELDDQDLVEWLQEKGDVGFSVDGKRLLYSGESRNRRDIQRELTDGLPEEHQQLRQKLTRIARRLGDVLNKGAGQVSAREKQEDARKELCRKYYDIRIFGAVLSTGLNAGQVRGPVQFTFARTVDPIQPLDLTITRQARTNTVRMGKKGNAEMGRKPVVPYGLYRAHGYFNPYLAKETGVTTQDLETLWDALQNLFEFDRSAARGEMHVRGLIVFTHDNPKGNAPAHKLFDLVTVRRRDGVSVPRGYHDYAVVIHRDDLPPGVTLSVLVEP